MKPHIRYTVIISLLLLCSCNQVQDNAKKNVISVDIDKNDNISIFDLFQKVEIVPLETNDLSFLRYISKVIYHNNLFYVFDFSEKKILAFDYDGRFKFKIDNRGQGPEEYRAIADFDIDKEGGIISLLDPQKMEFSDYSLEGHFLCKHKLPRLVNATYSSIKYINNNIVALWSFDYSNRLKFYSKSDKKVFKECFPEEKAVFDQIYSEDFVYGNFLIRNFDNNVYEMLPEGDISVAYTWDFGELNYDHNKLDKPTKSNDDKFLLDFIDKIKSSQVVNYYFVKSGGNSDFIFTTVLRKDKRKNIWYNKSNNKTLVYENTMEGAHFKPFCWTDDFVLGYFYDSYDLNEVLPDAILDEENIKKKNQINDDDNPVLIRYHFKK